MSAKQAEKDKIDQIIRHAGLMQHLGHLSDREFDLANRAMYEHLGKNLDDHELDYHNNVRDLSSYGPDEHEDPDIADKDRHAVIGKIVANLVSHPAHRANMSTAHLNTLKQFGLHPGDISDESLDDLHMRSMRPDKPMIEEDKQQQQDLEKYLKKRYSAPAPKAEREPTADMPGRSKREISRSKLDELLNEDAFSDGRNRDA
jgi:hypothetical protein